jgi:hypothetical protein
LARTGSYSGIYGDSGGITGGKISDSKIVQSKNLGVHGLLSQKISTAAIAEGQPEENGALILRLLGKWFGQVLWNGRSGFPTYG